MPTASINLVPQNGNASVIAINCGSSSPKLGGTINVSAFTNLTSFECNYNDITHLSGTENLTQLKILRAYYNKIINFPNLSTNPNIEVVDLVSNQFSGSFPDITSNSKLTYLNVAFNNFTGVLPSFAANPDLTLLYCYQNRLSGSLPDFSVNSKLQACLCQVQLGATKFSGPIPPLPTSIRFFNCRANQLSGTIPTLTLYPNLVEFNCGENLLTGTIPSLSACTNLETFSCNTNQLTEFAGGNVSNKLGTFNAQINQLTQSAINAILAAFVAANKTTGTRVLNLGGTGNAAPSGQGLTDKATLITRGWTVTTN